METGSGPGVHRGLWEESAGARPPGSRKEWLDTMPLCLPSQELRAQVLSVHLLPPPRDNGGRPDCR